MSEHTHEAKSALVRQLLLFSFLGPVFACIIFGIGAEIVLPQVGSEKYVPLLIGVVSSLPAGILFMMCAMFAVKFVVKREVDPSRWRFTVCAATYVAGVLIMAACYLALKIDGNDAVITTDIVSLFAAYARYTLIGAVVFAPVFLLAGPYVLRERSAKAGA